MAAPTNPSEAKALLRSEIRSARKDRERNLEDSTRIADHVMAVRAIRDACASGLPVACYLSRDDEPPTDVLRERLITEGARLLVPRVEGADLVWVMVTPDTGWSQNPWHITEPTGRACREVPAVWVIPALAVDVDGNRLGQGGGFYDRALASIAQDSPVIAVVFEQEVLAEVPHEDHDRRVDVVVTPERVRWLSMPD